MPRVALFVAVLGGLSTIASSGAAKPPGAQAFCETYPEAPACTQGQTDCTTCHSVPPALDLFGEQVSSALLPNEPRPLSDAIFAENIGAALAEVEGLDADGDGATNLMELMAGSNPSSPDDLPISESTECNANDVRPAGFDVCSYDPVYVFKKLRIDFCGIAPTYDEMKEFEADATPERIAEELDTCLDSEYWRGKDGVLWNMANTKIRPIQAIKSGAGAGPIPLADYEDDYNFFVYVLSDDRDARDLLTAKYFVEREDGETTTYSTFDRNLIEDYNLRGYEVAQAVARNKRAGMLTHRWFLMSNTMFTSIPRTTAAQAYRAYLGFDISKLEGLNETFTEDRIPGEPRDFDNKDVDQPACAVCHETLDPLTYPFSRYEGIGGGGELGDGYIPFTYNEQRITRWVEEEGPQVALTPEKGVIMGQEVDDLIEWAEVAANSDPFAQNIVNDFWTLLLGEEPQPNDLEEFDGIWRRFRTDHEYQVERMLHDLVTTEAYGVP